MRHVGRGCREEGGITYRAVSPVPSHLMYVGILLFDLLLCPLLLFHLHYSYTTEDLLAEVCIQVGRTEGSHENLTLFGLLSFHYGGMCVLRVCMWTAYLEKLCFPEV